MAIINIPILKILLEHSINQGMSILSLILKRIHQYLKRKINKLFCQWFTKSLSASS